MAIKKGSSKKTISSNIKELINEKPDSRPSKAIKTISKKQHIPLKEAKQKQSVAIALSTARKTLKKPKK
jgi:hypothetical protein